MPVEKHRPLIPPFWRPTTSRLNTIQLSYRLAVRRLILKHGMRFLIQNRFLNLYEHSSWYVIDASNFLSNDTFTERQKMICLNSLQGLSINKYVPILRRCDSLFNAGKIPESLLSWSLAPNFSNRHLVVRNYKNEDVRGILNDLLQNDRCTPDFKDLIKNILSGDLGDNIKDSGTR